MRALKELEAFPPDMIVATHAHWDHAQGIPTIRREAEKQHKGVEVLASQRAVPLLADPSYNDIFDAGPYERVEDVTPLKEGDSIDLGGIGLRIYEVPGHSADHVAILDEKNRNLFVGDTLGLKVHDDTFLPPFMPPLWDPEAFHSSIGKLKQVHYESVCLAHFGFIYGDEAKSILDEAVLTCEAWWRLFDENADRLDDVDYMSEAIMTELSPSIPDLTPVSPKIRLLLGLARGWSRLVGKSPPLIGEILLRQVVEMLATGYRVQKGLQRP